MKNLYHSLLQWLYLNSIEYFVNWRKHVRDFCWAIALVLVIRSTVGVVYRIPTGSMIPTFRVGDVLLANRFYYGLKLPFTDGKAGYRLPAIREPEVGDLVIFRSPPEALFYELTLTFSSQDHTLLRELNALAAPHKRPILTLNEAPWLNEAPRLGPKNGPQAEEKLVNYILLDQVDPAVSRLLLPEEVYLSQRDRIEAAFEILSIRKVKAAVGYETPLYFSSWRQLFEAPLAGLSLLATVLVNTPFTLPYRFFYGIWNSVSQPTATWLAAISAALTHKISLYPNPFLDDSKEYVKRLIAKEGDQIEMRRKKLYVNGRPLPQSKPLAQDPFDERFLLYQASLPHSPKPSLEKNNPSDYFTHSLRLSSYEIKPLTKFEASLWPFESESLVTASFRDNFGPLTVPKGHYFMLGDNRDESFDSRYFGAVPEWAVRGMPMFIFLPPSRIGLTK